MPVGTTETSIQNILKQKQEFRKEILNNFPFLPQKKNPIIGIWYDNQKDKNLASGLIEALKSLDIPVVLISNEDSDKIPIDFREKCSVVSLKSKIWRIYYGACDMMIVFSENVDENFLHDIWQNGIIPIAHNSIETISNYNPNEETGNSFTFSSKNIWEIFASTVRAIETFKFPYDWKHIIKQGLKTNF